MSMVYKYICPICKNIINKEVNMQSLSALSMIYEICDNCEEDMKINKKDVLVAVSQRNQYAKQLPICNENILEHTSYYQTGISMFIFRKNGGKMIYFDMSETKSTKYIIENI